MATDPNQGPLNQGPIQPLQPAPTIRQQQGSVASTNELQMLRDYVKALRSEKSKPFGPFYSWTQGMSDAAGDILGAFQQKRADEKEAARNALYESRRNPANLQGGDTQPTAASGGADAAAPFPQAKEGEDGPQSSQTQPPTQGQDPSQDQASPTHLASLGTTSGVKLSDDPVTDAAIRLTTQRETGKDIGRGALFTIAPDTGGSFSYGPFGLNSKSGSYAQFAKEHPELGLTAKGGTPEANAQWRRTAAVNPSGMKDALIQHYQEHNIKGLSDDMVKRGVDPKIANDPRVRVYMADRKDQNNVVGLDRAIMYAKVSNSPEEFMHRLSVADKQNIPYNFRSYLRENPNNVKGLVNGIDMRQNAALAMADPNTTGHMVDYYRDPQAADRSLPIQVAQNRLTPGSLESDTSRFLGGPSMNLSPEELNKAVQSFQEQRTREMPQYTDPNDLGLGYKKQLGTVPQPYLIPGVPGRIGTDQNSGLPTIQRINPRTRQPETIIQFPKFEGVGGQSENTPAPNKTAPPASAGGAVVQAPTEPPKPQNAPTATPAPTGGPLTASPPTKLPTTPGGPVTSPTPGVQVATAEGGAAPFQMALAAVSDKGKATAPTNQQIAQAEAASGASNPTNWEPYIERANRKPGIGSAYVPPDLQKLYTDAQSNPDPVVRQNARNTLMDLKSAKAANLKKAEQTDSKTAEEESKVSESINEAGIQGIKLQPSLKLANRIIKDEGFESGKLAGGVTDLRNLSGELKRINERFKNEDGSLQFPGVKELLDRIDAKKASPNEAFLKIVSGSVLQSLRSMLGPNSGQFRVQELKLLEQAYGNPNLSIEGNRVVMDMIDKINDRSIIYKKMADRYKQTHGGAIDANFEEAMNKYAEDHPTFNPTEYDSLLGIFQNGRGTETNPSAAPTPLNTKPPAPLQDPLGIRRR